MDDSKQNYYLKKNDLIGNKTIVVSSDDNDYSVQVRDSSVISVADEDGMQEFDIDHINSQLDAGAYLGAAITGEQETMNESTTSKIGYYVDVSNDTSKQKSFLFRKYPEHQALESAIEYANSVGGKVFSVIPRQGGGGKRGELVWDKTMNETVWHASKESQIDRKVTKVKQPQKKSPLNNLIKECVVEVLKEEIQNKKLQENQSVKKKLIPLIKEVLSEAEVDAPYWVFKDDDGKILQIKNEKLPNPPTSSNYFVRLSTEYISKKPIGKYMQAQAERGGSPDIKLASAIDKLIPDRMWKDVSQLKRLTKKSSLSNTF